MTSSARSPLFRPAGRFLSLLFSCALAAWGQGTQRPLPIYFEDNHAGTFQFLATTLDLNQPYTLVLVDAHSDSSRPGRLESIQSGIRRVISPEEREVRIHTWRRKGTLQAFDWILPLMPRPVATVIWVRPKESLTRKELESVPTGYVVSTPESFESKLPPSLPVVVSIDLDFFSGRPATEQSSEFAKLWSKILQIPGLSAISFAISRPWLSDDAEASRLLLLAMHASLSLGHASIRFEPFGIEGPDRSEKAKTFYRERREPPRFDPVTVSPELRSLLMANASCLDVRLDPARWQDLLGRWRSENYEWHIAVQNTQPCSDRIFRPSPESKPDLHIEGGSPGLIHRVTWVHWTPKAWSYNVLPELPAGKVFAGTSPPVMEYQATVLARTESLSLPARIWMNALPGPDHSGVLRVSADLEVDGGLAHTARIEIRRSVGSGFHAGLSEEFGLPYVFGAGFLRSGKWRGPDTGVGNDCANYLVYAWRRSGLRMPWCNPAQLRRHLTLVAKHVRSTDHLVIPEDAASRGLVIHMGSHVAALWEDREPIGTLGPTDLVAHHLGGAPEVISLGDLLSHRHQSTFDVYLGPSRKSVGYVMVGGDIMPGEYSAPPSGLKEALARADLAVANLETTIGPSGKTDQHASKRYVFRTPASLLSVLRAMGIQALSMANNHSGDFGVEGLKETLGALDTAHLCHFGGGKDARSAVSPWYGKVKGLTVAFLSVSVVDPDLLPADDQRPGMAVLPRHKREISEALSEAHRKAQCVIVLPHWGDEGTRKISDEQRRWALWFIQQGADAVVGTGPHVVQASETIKGAPVFYSTGNLWFQGKWPAESRNGSLILLGLDSEGHIVETQSIPVSH